MYLTKLTKVADSPALDSLGVVESGAFLALFKRHCALPSDVTWTEADVQLSAYLDMAERYVDAITGTPYRPHSYILDIQPDVSCLTSIKLPIFPITPNDVTVSWTDNDGVTGSFTNGTDFLIRGELTRSPEIFFQPNVDWPATEQVTYPFSVGFDSPAEFDSHLSKMAILEYASYLYRNPEGMGQEVANMGQQFWGLISLLSGTYL
jgi:hypothetical protein